MTQQSGREPSEMVRRVAEAICKVADDYDWTRWLGEAEAAITAMREPTDKMGWAGLRSRSATHGEHCAGNPAKWAMPEWRAMIDAALSDSRTDKEGTP